MRHYNQLFMLLSLILRSWVFVFFSKTCIFLQNKLTDIFAGPDGSYFIWKKNGQKMKACITEQSHMLFDGRVHVLSWVKDSVSENTEYKCSFISKAGNATSEVLITVEDKVTEKSSRSHTVVLPSLQLL